MKRIIVVRLNCTSAHYFCTLKNKKSIRVFMKTLGLLSILKETFKSVSAKEKREIIEKFGDGKDWNYIVKLDFEEAVEELKKILPAYMFIEENAL